MEVSCRQVQRNPSCTKLLGYEKSPLDTEHDLKIAYIMSRFPKITETFILYEIRSLERQGVQVEVYPLLRERTAIYHPAARAIVDRANFHPLFSWEICRAHWHFLIRTPLVYVAVLWILLRKNWGSLRLFIGVLAFFPKAVYFAHKMDSEGITHVHAHFASHAAAVAFVIKRLVGIPFSFTAHGSDIHRDKHMLREKVAESNFVVAISQYNKQTILQECDLKHQHKVRVLHCGVDTQVFRPRCHREKSHGTFQLVCIGTLHEVKGQRYLIESCRQLNDRGIDVACHFVGDGPDHTVLAKQIERFQLANRVHFHGRRTRDKIVQLLSHMDVLVTPSVPSRDGRREGIPVVLMEAMASGIPVVASRLSGIPELVQHERTGLLVAAGDPHELTEALHRLHCDPLLRRQLAIEARRKVIHEFEIHSNSATLSELFRQNTGLPSDNILGANTTSTSAANPSKIFAKI